MKKLFILLVTSLTMTSCVEPASTRQKVISKYFYYNTKFSKRDYFFTVRDERNKILDITVTADSYNKYNVDDSVYFDIYQYEYR